MGRSLCLFAHFDPQDRVDPYVLRYLEAIGRCGFDIVFVTTSAIGEADRAALAPLAIDVVTRTNEGLDFGSWAEGYRRHGAGFEGDILLANDSVYGPIGPLGPVVERLRELPGDVRGLVESLQHAPHLQSWFVLVAPAVHRHPAFRALLEQDFRVLTKKEIVASGEIALSVRLRDAGFSTAALFSPRGPGRTWKILNYNPTHTVWRALIESFGIPFLKVEVLRDNPLGLSDLGLWRGVVGARAPDLVPLIEAHRTRLGGHWAGEAKGDMPADVLSHQAFIRRDVALHRKRRPLARIAHSLAFEFAWLLLAARRALFVLRHGVILGRRGQLAVRRLYVFVRYAPFPGRSAAVRLYRAGRRMRRRETQS